MPIGNGHSLFLQHSPNILWNKIVVSKLQVNLVESKLIKPKALVLAVQATTTNRPTGTKPKGPTKYNWRYKSNVFYFVNFD